MLYTEQRLIAAFANDIVSYGGQAVLIAALSWQSRLSGSEVLYAMAWSSWAAALLGAWQLRCSLGRHIDLSSFAQNWGLGKWLLGAQIAGEWLSTQLYLFLAAAALGPAAAGILRAVHTLFGPTRILAQVLSLVLPTRLARTLAKSGEEAFRAEFRTAALWAVPLLGGYCLLAALLAKPLLILAYGDTYRDQGSVLALYAVATFLGYLTILGEVALRAKRMTRHIFRSELWSLLVVPSSWLMIPVLGIHGVVLGMAFADLALAWLLWRAYREGDRQP